MVQRNECCHYAPRTFRKAYADHYVLKFLQKSPDWGQSIAVTATVTQLQSAIAVTVTAVHRNAEEQIGMWTSRLVNGDFLLKIYGGVPALNHVEITGIELNRDGPLLKIKTLLHDLPKYPPPHWREYDTISIIFDYFPVSKIILTDFKKSGFSSIQMESKPDGNIRCVLSGSVDLSFEAEHIYIDHVSWLLSDPDEM